jgi:lipopolysaccharide export system protein LptA
MGNVPVTQSLTRLGSDTLSYDLVWGKQLATNHIHYTVEAALKPMEIRFIRVSAKSVKKLPADHLGAGKPAWLFLDEIFVR